MKPIELINRISLFLLLMMIGTITIYLIGVFMWAEFDITKWDSVGRGCYVFAAETILLIGSIVIALDSKS
jgi:hypothetical protein